MKKRMISLCLVLSMVLTFAGCGNESNGSADNTQGNVQELAGWVQEETGGDLFSIQVTDPYPSDWDACLERATFRLPILIQVTGMPVWNGQMKNGERTQGRN